MSAKVLAAERVAGYARHALPTISGPIVGEHPGPDARAAQVAAPSAEEIARIREQARQEAYQQGLAQAYTETVQRVKEEVARLARLCEQLTVPLANVDDQVVDAVAELAVTIARHLVRRELRYSPGEVVGVVREAMRQLPLATRRARVHLHPEDLAIVQEALAIRADTAWELEADPLITRGGCIVETETSRVDAQVESRLSAIASRLLGGERGDDRGR